MKLFDITLKLNGFPIDKTKKGYDEILSISEEEFVEFNEKRKNEIVNYHLKKQCFL